MGTEKLSRDVFITLAAIGWADGKLEPDEADAIARAALEEGLDLDEVAAIEEATQKPVKMADIPASALSSADRLYVYAVSCWIAHINGEVHPVERAALDALSHTLELTRRGKAAMESAVTELLAQPEAKRPSRFDLPGLRKQIRTKIDAEAKKQPASD